MHVSQAHWTGSSGGPAVVFDNFNEGFQFAQLDEYRWTSKPMVWILRAPADHVFTPHRTYRLIWAPVLLLGSGLCLISALLVKATVDFRGRRRKVSCHVHPHGQDPLGALLVFKARAMCLLLTSPGANSCWQVSVLLSLDDKSEGRP